MSHFQDLQCRIYRDPVFNGVSIMFYTKHSDGKIYVVKPVNLELVPHEEYATVQPTIQLSGSSAESMLKSLADELDKQGVKTDSDAKIAGTLEATRFHLEDMRGMLAWFTSPEHQHGD